MPGPRRAEEREVCGRDSFHLEIEGISAARFVRCSGLGASRPAFSYAEGGAAVPRLFPGEHCCFPIVLERGVARDGSLFDWHSRGDRRDGAVVLLSLNGMEVMRWAFSRGLPSRWEGPLFDADRGEAALELLEISHEGLQCLVR